jgi:hypothetical protein
MSEAVGLVSRGGGGLQMQRAGYEHLAAFADDLRVSSSQWQWGASRFVSFSKEIHERHVTT